MARQAVARAILPKNSLPPARSSVQIIVGRCSAIRLTIRTASADAFELLYTIVNHRLKRNRLTVADATNLSAPYRNRLRQIAGNHNKPVFLVVFTTDIKQCLANNNQRQRQVERYVIENQIAKLQTALENIPYEQYQQLYKLTSAQTNNLQVQITPAGPNAPA